MSQGTPTPPPEVPTSAKSLESATPPALPPHRWRRRLLWTLLLVTCLTAGVSLLTQWGLRLLVTELQRLVPGLAISHVEGTLAGHVAIGDLRYVSSHEEIRLDSLSITADPWCLMRRRICVEAIEIGTLDWNTTSARPSTPFDFPGITLPAFILPVNITLADVRMKEMIIRHDDFRMSIAGSTLRAHTDRQHVIIDEAQTRLQFEGLGLDVQLSGDVDLRGERTVNLSPRVALDFDGVEDLSIEGELRGPALTPTLQARTRGLVDASVELDASFLEKGWPVKGKVRDHEPTRLTEDGLSLSNTVADISGHVVRYHVKGSTRISGIPHTPDVDADIETTGLFTGLETAVVHARFDEQQKARYEGSFGWYPTLSWNGELHAENIDAAHWISSLKTSLSGSARTSGQWWPDEPLILAIDDLDLEGEWQGQAVTAKLKGKSHGWNADIDALSASIGKNQVTAQGSLGQQWNAEASLNLPELAVILPGLQGSVSGKAGIRGDRKDPVIEAAATSPLLVIADSRWESLTASINGTAASHHVAASASTLGYGLAITADGQWQAGHWKARTRHVEASRDKRRLTAESPVAIDYQLSTSRLQVAGLCLTGNTPAGKTSTGKAKALQERWCGDTRLGLTPLEGDIHVRLENANPAWLDPFAATFYNGLPGRWSGEATLTLQAGQPASARWTAAGSGLRLKRIAGTTLKPALLSDELISKGEWSKGRLTAEATSQWPDGGRLATRVDVPSLQDPLTATVSLMSNGLPLAWITPWTGGISRSQGSLSGTLEGQLLKGWPRLKGRMQLVDGGLGVSGDTLDVRDLEATLVADNEQLTLEGAFTDPQSTRWNLTDPVRVRLDAKARSLAWLSGCLGHEAGSLCGTGEWSPRQGLAMDARAQGSLNPWITPFLQEGVIVDGPFEGELHLREDKGRLKGNARLRSLLTASTEPAIAGQETRANILVNATLDNGVILVESALSTGEQGILAANLRLGLAPPHNLAGELDVRGLDLAMFAPLFPELGKLQGRLGGHVRVNGTTGSPVLAGEFNVSDGKASSTRFPLTLQHFTARVLLNDSSATLNVDFTNGRGKGELRGQADWTTGELVTRTHLSTRQFPMRRGSEIKIRVDSDLTLESRPGDIRLEGLVKVNEGFIRIASLPETATQVSSDIVLVDDDTEGEGLDMPNVHAQVTLELTDLLQIDALGAQVRMNGSVMITYRPPLDPEGKGAFTVAEGYYKGYGQKLTIKRGQVIFNGPLDNPLLAITAVRQVDTVEAGLNITGPAQQPETTLFANKGGLSEQDILTYIITGRAPSEGAGDNRAAVNQALLAIGLYGGEDVARNLASKVGIEDLEISTSSTQKSPTAEVENSFNVGGYVSPRLFVQYGVGINTPVNTLTLRYRLSRNVFLEALSGAESALDILYSFEVERKGTRE